MDALRLAGILPALVPYFARSARQATGRRRKGQARRVMARTGFSRYAWGLLGYNLGVILGGAYVRASISGDGCGRHWPDCNGQLIPHHGRVETLIEFCHRASSGLLVPLILLLVFWAFRAFPRRHPARLGALLALA